MRVPLTAQQKAPRGARAIQLTQGWAAWVDKADYAELSAHVWCTLIVSNGRAYAVREIDNKAVYMHRLILNSRKSQEVDHRKHLSEIKVVDNRRSNLRACTRTQNLANQSRLKLSIKRPFKGVAQCDYFGKRGMTTAWKAGVTVAGKLLYFGRYKKALMAAVAYDAAAMFLFGEFAYTNFSWPESTNSLHGCVPLPQSEIDTAAWTVMRHLAAKETT